MAFVVAVLLVSWLATYGLIALFLASTPRHLGYSWLVACVAFLPFYAAEAYELALAFMAEILVILLLGRFLNCRGLRRTDAQHDESSRLQRTRISMSDLVILLTAVAVVVSLVVHTPDLNARGWVSMVAMGLGSGLCVTATNCGRQWSMFAIGKWFILGILSLLFAVPLAWLDWFVPSLVGWAGWPPESIGPALFMGIGDEDRPTVLWFFIMPGVSGATYLWLEWNPWRVLFRLRHEQLRRLQAVLGVFMAVLTTSSFLALWGFAGWMTWQLVRPVGVPSVELPEPNGYHQILRIAEDVANSGFEDVEWDLDWEHPSEPEFARAVSGTGGRLASLPDVFEVPCRAPVDYDSQEFDMEAFMRIRTLGRALVAQGKLATLRKRPNIACDWYLSCVRLGFVTRRGGLLIHGQVGMACTANGLAELYRHRSTFSVRSSLAASQTLIALTNNAEGYEQFSARDQIWAQRANGWHGRLQLTLAAISDFSLLFTPEELSAIYRNEKAVVRLLATELALQAFLGDRGTLPKSLDELVPAYMARVPADPYNATGAPLKYRIGSEELGPGEFRVYSVGPDGVDNQGVWQDDEGTESILPEGDFLLLGYFSD